MSDAVEPREGVVRGHGFEARIVASGYERPDGIDEDAQWVVGTVEVSVTGKVRFHASSAVTFWAPELQAFSDQLRELHAGLSGNAVLTHLEDEHELRIHIESGKGTISGYVQEHRGTRLEFADIATDQSLLYEIAAGMESIVDAFPPR
jgi:hypothetical protein